MGADQPGLPARPRITCVKVYLEDAEDSRVDALMEAIEHELCSVDHSDPLARCPIPWSVDAYEVGAKKAAKISPELNR